MSNIEKFLYFNKAGIYLRGVMSIFLMTFAVAILVRIFMPNQILTLRLLAAAILLIIALYLLCSEFGHFGENLAAFHKKEMRIQIYNDVYNAIFSSAKFYLSFKPSHSPKLIRFHSIFSKSQLYFLKEQKIEIHPFSFLGFQNSPREIESIISEEEKKNIPLLSKIKEEEKKSRKKKSSLEKNNEITEPTKIYIYSFFSKVDVFIVQFHSSEEKKKEKTNKSIAKLA